MLVAAEKGRKSVIQNPKCWWCNCPCLFPTHLPNICGPVAHNAALRPQNGSSEVTTAMVKHSNSPAYLWFHSGRWLHSQLCVPSGHRWSIPAKETRTINKQGETKHHPSQEQKRLHLVANCRGSRKTYSCFPVTGNAKAKQSRKFKLLWRSFSVNMQNVSQSQAAGLAAGFIWPTWLIFFVAIVLLPKHTLQHIFITEQTIMMKWVLIKETI